jgi:acetolactate synthase-1/2/3 large subunit
VALINNSSLGMVRQWQTLFYESRYSNTDLHSHRIPDFVKLAQAYGCHAERVTETSQFAAAFARAREAGVAALIELVIDPQAITAGQTLDEIRAKALVARN